MVSKTSSQKTFQSAGIKKAIRVTEGMKEMVRTWTIDIKELINNSLNRQVVLILNDSINSTASNTTTKAHTLKKKNKRNKTHAPHTPLVRKRKKVKRFWGLSAIKLGSLLINLMAH